MRNEAICSQPAKLQPARKASTAISESICVFSTGALKEFIERHVRTEKIADVTRVLLEQKVTNIVLLMRLPRAWLIKHLGNDAAQDILIASFDEQVIHHPHAHPTSKMDCFDSRIRPRRCAHSTLTSSHVLTCAFDTRDIVVNQTDSVRANCTRHCVNGCVLVI